MLLIAAGKFSEAARHAELAGIDNEDWIFAHRPEHLRGYERGSKITFVGTWEDRPDSAALLKVARDRQFKEVQMD